MKLNLDAKTIKRKIVKIPRIYKLIFIVGFNAILFGVLFYLLVMPQMETKKQLQGEFNEVKANLDRLLVVKNNLPKAKAEFEKVKEELRQTLTQLPDTKDIPNLVRNIWSVSSENRLNVKYFEPKGIQPKEFYGEVPFEIRFSGNFHNVAHFFDGVRRLERIIDVTSFSLEAPAKMDPRNVVLEGRATAKTYVYLREDQKPKKQEQKKDEGKDAKSGAPAKK
jgi:type IV pilus assembly protein PilO